MSLDTKAELTRKSREINYIVRYKDGARYLGAIISYPLD